MNLARQIIFYILRRIGESFYISYLRLKHFFSGGYNVAGESVFDVFKADLSNLSQERRLEGISGFYRVKNEAQFLRASVEAHIPYLDEIIIVYNDCTDETPEIAKDLEREYPNKVKVYEYLPKVSPALSFGHIVNLSSSVHSLVNYYNYTLSKTTRKIAVKVDADHIPVQPQFSNVADHIRKNGLHTMRYFYGVNIYLEDGEVYVNKKKPFTHGFDCGFFPVSEKTYFVHRQDSESLRLPFNMYFSRKPLGVLFYHLKGVKLDKGLGNLQVENSQSKKIKELMTTVDQPVLVDWKEAVTCWPKMLDSVSEPDLTL